MSIRTGARGLKIRSAVSIGIAFLTIGICFLTKFDHPAKNEWPFLLVMGSFLVAGTYLLVWRRWIVLDRGQRLVGEKSGPLFPLRSRVQKLSLEDRVYLRTGVTDSDPSGQGGNGYTIALSDLKRGIVLYQCGIDRNKAVNKAEEIANFLGVDLVDKSTGEDIVRKPKD